MNFQSEEVNVKKAWEKGVNLHVNGKSNKAAEAYDLLVKRRGGGREGRPKNCLKNTVLRQFYNNGTSYYSVRANFRKFVRKENRI